MSRRSGSTALEVAQLLITAFIWMLAGMFLVSRMYGPAAAYASLAGASSAFRLWGWMRQTPSARTSHKTEITYPYSLPSWLTTPYGAPDRCYGCGLTPEIMSPHDWILCFWCNELRLTIKRRMKVSLIGV